MKPLLLALVLSCLGCGGACPTAARPCPVGTCASACANLRTLACPAGNPTPAGVSCEDVCAAAQLNGIDFHTVCKTGATNCSTVDKCHLR